MYFVNHARGRPLRIEPVDDQPELCQKAEDFLSAHSTTIKLTDEEKSYFHNFVRTYRGELLPDGKNFLILEGNEQKPEILEGVWDLLMLGAERLDVEHEYQSITGGPAVDLVCLGGPLISSPDRSSMFQLLDNYKRSARPPKQLQPSAKPKLSKEKNENLDCLSTIPGNTTVTLSKNESQADWNYEIFYYPAAALPKDSTFVVRTAALRDLEKKLLSDEAVPEKPLHQNERKSTEQIIATLAAMADLDLSMPYKADETLRAAAATYQLELPNSPETTVKFLKAAATRSGIA